MIGEMMMRCDHDLSSHAPTVWRRDPRATASRRWRALAQLITALENGNGRRRAAGASCTRGRRRAKTPVLGITGTGGAGKSSLTDELIRRLRLDQDDALRIAVI